MGNYCHGNAGCGEERQELRSGYEVRWKREKGEEKKRDLVVPCFSYFNGGIKNVKTEKRVHL